MRENADQNNPEYGQSCNFIKKETLAQLFSCEFCEISTSTFFHRTPLMAASVNELVRIDVLLTLLRRQYSQNMKVNWMGG